MDIAVIKDNTVINVLVFEDFETAQDMFDQGIMPGEPDEIKELPEGFGIGDDYIDGEWISNRPEPPEPEPQEPDSQLSQDEVDWVKGLISGVGGLGNE